MAESSRMASNPRTHGSVTASPGLKTYSNSTASAQPSRRNIAQSLQHLPRSTLTRRTKRRLSSV
ncbi:hypothetical protein LB505_006514 [Fusarium chuoi]|nr:hypothetical protein LB505_006514 [Fusarium chuoi]